MSAPTNHWKLGAFVVGGVLIGVIAVVVLGAEALRTQSVSYTSFFDEAVTGLEVGSPVSFRGVKIGNVSAIDVAPDRRHVEITYNLGTKVLGRLGLAGETHGVETRISVPDNLRVQLASTGLTGTKYLQLDFFDVASYPVPELPFPVPENYIPGASSTMKNLEDAVVRAVDSLPVIAADIGKLLAKMDYLLDDVHDSRLPAKAATMLVTANQTLLTLQAKLGQLKVEGVVQGAGETLKHLDVTLSKVNHTLEAIDGDKGLVASVQRVSDSMTGRDGLLTSVQRASDSLGDVTGNGLAANLHDTLRDLREAAVGIRRLVEALERDPEMLVKGKGKASP